MRHFSLGFLTALLVLVNSSAMAATPERDEAVIQGVNYIGVAVSNLAQASAFYSAAVDLESVQSGLLENNAALDRIAGRSGVKAHTHLLKSVNSQVRLMQFENPSQLAQNSPRVEVNGPGIAHICYQVATDTRAYQQFLDLGASHIGERELVQLNPANPVVYAYARDTDEIMFEVEHIDFDAISRPRKHDYRIRHISLATPNIDSMVGFYSILIEEPEPRRSGTTTRLSGEAFDKVSGLPGTELEMAWFQVRNLELEIIQYHSHTPEQPSNPRPIDALGYNLVMFDAANLDAASDLVVRAGGILVSEPQEMDGGRAFFARDPDGNLLGFQEVASQSPVSSRNFADNGT